MSETKRITRDEAETRLRARYQEERLRWPLLAHDVTEAQYVAANLAHVMSHGLLSSYARIQRAITSR